MYKNVYNIPPVMTFNDARSILKIGRNKMLELIHSGELPAFRIGNRWRVSKESLISYIEGQ